MRPNLGCTLGPSASHEHLEEVISSPRRENTEHRSRPDHFALEGGDGAEAAEFARLKGERDALEQAAVQKSCSLTEIPKIVTTPPVAKKTKEESRQ